MNQRSLENLESHKWRKGRSGNPGGRPSKQPITQALAKVVGEREAEQLARIVWRHAKKGEPWAIHFIADRLEGKAIARNEMGEPGDFDLGLEQARKVLQLGKYRDPSRNTSVEP
jgi:hypothetical protein